jgi:putative transcriptional regulator
MAKSGMTLAEILAGNPDVDLAKIDATTEDDIRRHMIEDGYDPDETVREEDIISPAVIRKRLGMSQRRFADAIHVPVATLQNWEQGRTLMDPSARALMTILAREPEAALRALGHQRAA